MPRILILLLAVLALGGIARTRRGNDRPASYTRDFARVTDALAAHGLAGTAQAQTGTLAAKLDELKAEIVALRREVIQQNRLA